MGEDQPKRGGKRENAGRRSLPYQVIKKMYMVRPEQDEYLSRVGEGNASAALRRIIDRAMRDGTPE